MKGSPARVEGVVAPVEVGRWRGRRVRKGSARAAHAPHAVGLERGSSLPPLQGWAERSGKAAVAGCARDNS